MIAMKAEDAPYEAFVMGLGLYVVSYLCNSLENDPEQKIVKLVRTTFGKAL